jgi:hypothetical protein
VIWINATSSVEKSWLAVGRPVYNHAGVGERICGGVNAEDLLQQLLP